MIPKPWTMGSKNAKKIDCLHELQKVIRHTRLTFALFTVKAIHICPWKCLAMTLHARIFDSVFSSFFLFFN